MTITAIEWEEKVHLHNIITYKKTKVLLLEPLDMWWLVLTAGQEPNYHADQSNRK